MPQTITSICIWRDMVYCYSSIRYGALWGCRRVRELDRFYMRASAVHLVLRSLGYCSIRQNSHVWKKGFERISQWVFKTSCPRVPDPFINSHTCLAMTSDLFNWLFQAWNALLIHFTKLAMSVSEYAQSMSQKCFVSLESLLLAKKVSLIIRKKYFREGLRSRRLWNVNENKKCNRNIMCSDRFRGCGETFYNPVNIEQHFNRFEKCLYCTF